jgi:hypothetical protein
VRERAIDSDMLLRDVSGAIIDDSIDKRGSFLLDSDHSNVETPATMGMAMRTLLGGLQWSDTVFEEAVENTHGSAVERILLPTPLLLREWTLATESSWSAAVRRYVQVGSAQWEARTYSATCWRVAAKGEGGDESEDLRDATFICAVHVESKGVTSVARRSESKEIPIHE